MDHSQVRAMLAPRPRLCPASSAGATGARALLIPVARLT
jgi:hypothetical protein